RFTACPGSRIFPLTARWTGWWRNGWSRWPICGESFWGFEQAGEREGIEMLQQVEEKRLIFSCILPDGTLTDEGQAVWRRIDDGKKRLFYRWMTMVRLFDRRCVNLQRQGRIGTFAPLEGQEAAQVGSAMALSKGDWIFPTYREHGVQMVVGMPLNLILLYWMGRVEGWRPPEGLRLLPPSVPIATQLPHAAGAAWASKLK